MSETDERIVDAFLDHYQRRPYFDVDVAKATLLRIYPSLVRRLDIVRVEGRRVLVKRPAS